MPKSYCENYMFQPLTAVIHHDYLNFTIKNYTKNQISKESLM